MERAFLRFSSLCRITPKMRLQAALTRLRERLEEVKAQEEDQQLQLVYDGSRQERDKLAAELAEIYPAFANKLAALLPRIVANDREIEYINSRSPSGTGRLLVAELVARNLEGFGKSHGNIVIRTPRITEELCLPTLNIRRTTLTHGRGLARFRDLSTEARRDDPPRLSSQKRIGLWPLLAKAPSSHTIRPVEDCSKRL